MRKNREQVSYERKSCHNKASKFEECSLQVWPFLGNKSQSSTEISKGSSDATGAGNAQLPESSELVQSACSLRLASFGRVRMKRLSNKARRCCSYSNGAAS